MDILEFTRIVSMIGMATLFLTGISLVLFFEKA